MTFHAQEYVPSLENKIDCHEMKSCRNNDLVLRSDL